jgi:2-phospho-L-lactate guanylyltransferase (CobY/MobA/RfbA family)
MDDIKAWLQGPKHYRVGVMLYLKHGTNALFKKSLVQEGESAFKKHKLVKELSSIEASASMAFDSVKASASIGFASDKAETQKQELKQEPAPSKINEPSPTEAPLSPRRGAGGEGWPRSSCRDDYELSLWERAMLLLKQIAALHAKLSECFSDFERRSVAFNLLRMDDELDDIYEKRDHYRATKSQKEEVAIEIITDPFLMGQRLANLTRYIRREKQNIITKGDTTDRQKRLSDYLAEYNLYAEKLNRPLKT